MSSACSAMARNMEKATGRTLEDWVEVVLNAPVDGFMDRVGRLEDEHGLGHFQARRIVEEAANARH